MIITDMNIRTISQNLIFLVFISLIFNFSAAKTCSTYQFPADAAFDSCDDLPYLNAYLHWAYIPSTRILHVAYRAAKSSSSGWIAWAINPTGTGMVGSQSLVAFHNSKGGITVYPTSIDSYSPSMQQGDLSFKVSNVSAEYSNNEMTIFAVLGPFSNATTTINHVWQAGDTVSSDDVPKMHPASGDNIKTMGTLDLAASA